MKRAMSLLLSILFFWSVNVYAAEPATEPTPDINATAEPPIPPTPLTEVKPVHKPVAKTYLAKKPMHKHMAAPKHRAKNTSRHAAKHGVPKHKVVKKAH